MAIDYKKSAQTASRLIRENGKPVTIERPAQGMYNATTGKTDFGDGDGKSQVIQTRGVLRNYDAKLIDGALIKASDRELLLDERFKPEVTDKVFMDGKKVGDIIAPIKEVNTGGVPIMYKVQIRI